jgi:hypothetical protein
MSQQPGLASSPPSTPRWKKLLKAIGVIGVGLSLLANSAAILGFFGIGPWRILELAADNRASSVEIAWPSGREPIPRCIEVRGTSSPLPPGEALWASIYSDPPAGSEKVYYLGSRAEYDRDRPHLWSTDDVIVGTKTEGKSWFTIVMIHTRSNATEAYKAILQAPGDHNIGSKLIPGARETASLKVQRSSVNTCS